MRPEVFYDSIQGAAQKAGVNPVLLLSGIEGLYTFRNIPMNEINYNLLDSLILTIFTLRIGDQFHHLAEQQSQSANKNIRQQAREELRPLSEIEVQENDNTLLQSFAQLTGGKTAIYNYHIKALEVATQEIKNTLRHTGGNSIGTIVLGICGDKDYGLDLGLVFSS